MFIKIGNIILNKNLIRRITNSENDEGYWIICETEKCNYRISYRTADEMEEEFYLLYKTLCDNYHE